MLAAGAHGVGPDRHRRPHLLLDAVGHARGVLRVFHARHQDRELVAAQAGHGVAGPHAHLQPARDLDEHEVAGGVAVDVVHGLEVVEVDEEHGEEGPRAAAGPAQRFRHPLDEQGAVGEAGERVVGPAVRGVGLRAGHPVGLAVGGRAPRTRGSGTSGSCRRGGGGGARPRTAWSGPRGGRRASRAPAPRRRDGGARTIRRASRRPTRRPRRPWPSSAAEK